MKNELIVYHGSNLEVSAPKLGMNMRPLDFAKGFYVTENFEQAKVWAIKRADRFGNKPVISKYKIELGNLKIKQFNSANEEWLNFVCDCRRDINLNFGNIYDVIMGPVADDTVFRIVTFYEEGTYDLDYALKKLKINNTYNQLCICSQEGLNNLNFIDSEVL